MFELSKLLIPQYYCVVCLCRYVEFLLLLTKIQTMLGSYHLSSLHSSQAATLLHCKLPVCSGGSKGGNEALGPSKGKRSNPESLCDGISQMSIIDSESSTSQEFR